MAPNLGKPAFADYPYDENYDALSSSELSRAINKLEGLDRLRAISDRTLAKYLYELWFHVKDPSPRELEAERREAEELDVQLLESMTDKALDGTYGPESVSLAKRIVQPHRNAVTMRQLRIALSNLGERRRSG